MRLRICVQKCEIIHKKKETCTVPHTIKKLNFTRIFVSWFNPGEIQTHYSLKVYFTHWTEFSNNLCSKKGKCILINI